MYLDIDEKVMRCHPHSQVGVGVSQRVALQCQDIQSDQGQLADWLTHTRKTYSRKSTTLNDSSRQLNTTQDILGCFDLLVFVLCIHVLCTGGRV